MTILHHYRNCFFSLLTYILLYVQGKLTLILLGAEDQVSEHDLLRGTPAEYRHPCHAFNARNSQIGLNYALKSQRDKVKHLKLPET